MTAVRIRCTRSALDAGFQKLGLVPVGGTPDPVADPEAALAGSGLVDAAGRLTPTAAAVLSILARPGRVLAVTAVSPGRDAVDATAVVAPLAGGPFVFRGEGGGRVDLLAVDSPTAACALLDEIMAITALPTDGTSAELSLSLPAWWGFLAACDATRAAELESRLARRADGHAPFEADELTRQLDEALGGDDTSWVLGALARVDRDAVVAGKEAVGDALADLVDAGLLERVGDSCRLTEDGRAWAGPVGSAVRVSQLRVVHVIEGTPLDVGRFTYLRAPSAVVVAHASSGGVRLSRSPAEVVAATLREILGAEDDVPDEEVEAGASPGSGGGEAPTAAEPAWVYVLDPVAVRGLHQTQTVVGSARPGTWYLLAGEEGPWARVADPGGDLEGWVPAAALHHRRAEPSRAVQAWKPGHTAVAGGLRAWSAPDPNAPVAADVAGGTPLQVVERLGDWARVRAENGWEAWVDARRLQEL